MDTDELDEMGESNSEKVMTRKAQREKDLEKLKLPSTVTSNLRPKSEIVPSATKQALSEILNHDDELKPGVLLQTMKEKLENAFVVQILVSA